MQINSIRKIDKYVGPAVCRIFLIIREILKIGRGQRDISISVADCKSILIIKFFGMGTLLLASPSFRALQKKYPYAKITVLTLTSNRELCEMLPSVRDVLCLQLKSLFSFLVDFSKVLVGFRKKPYDVVLNMEFMTHFSALVSILASLIGNPKIIVGFNSPIRWRNKVHDINVAFDHSRHITKIISKMISSLDVEASDSSFEPEKYTLLERRTSKYADELFVSERGLSDAKYVICVNINAGDLCSHRKWPMEYFAVLIDDLLQRPHTAIILTGGKNDVQYVSEFKKVMMISLNKSVGCDLDILSRIIDISGQTDIKKLTAIFSRCNLLITNDSGPLHLAYVVGLPTVSFFGPETPYLYGPLENKGHYVFYKDMYCSPCLNVYNSKASFCGDNLCLKKIKPSDVLDILYKNVIF